MGHRKVYTVIKAKGKREDTKMVILGTILISAGATILFVLKVNSVKGM